MTSKDDSNFCDAVKNEDINRWGSCETPLMKYCRTLLDVRLLCLALGIIHNVYFDAMLMWKNWQYLVCFLTPPNF
jgi:hypothetical protein